MRLYQGVIPNSIASPNVEWVDANNSVFKVSQPTLTVFTPDEKIANGTAVIICPGGAYCGLVTQGEGVDLARRLNALGITAFVLKYRLPDDKIMPDKSIGPIQDLQRAMLIVKSRANEWKIDTTKVGVIGFSAGGHLAAFLGTHFNHQYIENPSRISFRPNFLILVYPVISFTDSLTNLGTRDALIGKNPSASKIREYSNELNVTAQTPSSFLIQAEDDELVSVKNSIAFFLSLQKNKVPAGLHIFPTGQHGFPDEPAKDAWFGYCSAWLKENKWIH